MSIKITKKLREHMVEHFAIDSEAPEAEVTKSVSAALVSGTLTMEVVKGLTAEESPKSKLEEALDTRFKSLRDELVGSGVIPVAGGDGASVDGKPTGTATSKTVTKAFAGAARGGVEDGGNDEVNIRVKSVMERFSHVPTAAIFDNSQVPELKSFGHELVTKHFSGCGLGSHDVNMPTQRDKAVTGVWLKHLVNKQCQAEGRQVPWQFKMTEQDEDVRMWTMMNCKFVGPVGYKGEPITKYSDTGVDTDAADHWFGGESLMEKRNDFEFWKKALLDDATSGGLEAVPIEFDAAYILTPLLTGQLFPYVDVRNVMRRRIEGTKFANPTMGWGTAEGTGITPYTTDAFISAFDNSIWPITGAMEIGRDFQSDSPLDIGGIVTDRYGQAFRQEMDNVIANGNGTNRPEGLFVASGVTTNTSAGGSGADPTPGDYEGLMHGVGLAFLQEAGLPPNSRAVFLSTQTSYQRSRGIKIASGDERRFFGRDGQMSYRTYDFRHAINASAGNAKLGFFCLNRYTMYRRQGLEVRIVRDDRTGALANTDMLVLRARFGGALNHSSAGMKIEDAKA